MKAGFSKMTITPEFPVELWGFAKRAGKATGVLHGIFVKVLVLNDSLKHVVLISLDVGGIDGNFAKRVKETIFQEYGIPVPYVCISVTHTHSAPAIFPLRNAGTPDEKYLKMLQEKIVWTVHSALMNIADVKIGYGVGKLYLGVNRREMGIKNDIAQDAGTVDPDVSIITVDKMDGSPLVLLVNYAVHPVTLYADNLLVSADYPGVAYQVIAETLSCEMMFFQGACADVNPKIFGSHEATYIVGKALANEVHARTLEIVSNDITQLEMVSQRITLPLSAPPSIEELNALILKYSTRTLTTWEKTELEWASDLIAYLKINGEAPREVELPLQMLKLGDIIILLLPGEIFVATGLTVKQKLNGKIFLAAYANDTSFGYLPTIKAFSEGAYEVESAYKYYGLFQFAPAAEERLIENVIRSARLFKR